MATKIARVSNSQMGDDLPSVAETFSAKIEKNKKWIAFTNPIHSKESIQRMTEQGIERELAKKITLNYRLKMMMPEISDDLSIKRSDYEHEEDYDDAWRAMSKLLKGLTKQLDEEHMEMALESNRQRKEARKD